MGRTPVPYTRTQPVAVESNEDRHARQVGELEAGTLTGGLVWGLPELPDGDMWVDIFGVSALTGLTPVNIRGRLHRREKYRNVFPAPYNYFAMTWWPLSEIKEWLAVENAGDNEEQA